ncbi:hypothetical protein DWF00_07515 [Bosea caraganae]|uniref:Resolvase/invertase-type recombinase catalytic domain-containing protein n=1 Tax=Bosea caraganae TaxID=2763117 RepID=A0A370L115_9HYPH|nr:recombinase family protein [Bosea caraganae]RDJ21059.1 hypothetical protein DWE98_22310 [Bosea caraganae]RDJ28558.1 hypothetical protein DWF00_07515 [Bosea caraganae]
MRPETNIPAVIYCRVANTTISNKGDALVYQEARCREYAARKGYAVAEVFRDAGVSGTAVDRPGMRAMLVFLKEHGPQNEHVVVIDDTNRLARGLETYVRLRTEIAAAGGKLESPSIELRDAPESRLVESVLASTSLFLR